MKPVVIVFAALLAVAVARFAACQSNEVSGTIEVIDVVIHVSDPWGDFRAHLAHWWLDEHQWQISLLQKQRFTDKEAIEKRNQRIAEHRAKLPDARKALRFAQRDAAKGMVEVRGWDAARSGEPVTSPFPRGAVVLQCRDAFISKARQLNPGDFVDYIAEGVILSDEEVSLDPLPNKHRWKAMAPSSLERVGRPDGWPTRDVAQPLLFETRDATGEIEMTIRVREYTVRSNSHAFTVIEAEPAAPLPIGSPSIREVHVAIQLVDDVDGTVTQTVTKDGPFILRHWWVGTVMGFSSNSTEFGRGHLRMPYPAAPPGRHYRFTVERLLVGK
ncbi:MAG: hypothetical protein ACR2GY_13670 [Phycisphaerales bacterium]